MKLRPSIGSCALALLGACQVVETERLATPTPVVRTAQAERAWRALADGELVGRVVLFCDHGDAGGGFFSVRNAWSQDLGIIDDLGRAWGYRPHHEEAEWLGTGTVSEGVSRILGHEECVLVETALPTTVGAAHPASSPGR